MCLCKNHISKVTIPIKIPQRWNVQSSFCFQINNFFKFIWKLLFFNVTCISHIVSPSSPPGLWAARAEEQEVEERGKHTANSVSVRLLQTILFYTNSSKSCLYEMHKTQQKWKQIVLVYLHCFYTAVTEWIHLQVDSLSEEQHLLTEALRAHEPFCPIMHCSFASSTSSTLQPENMAARSVWGREQSFLRRVKLLNVSESWCLCNAAVNL